MRWLRGVGALTGLCVMTACSSPSAATPAVGQVGGGHAASTPAASAAWSGSVTPAARTVRATAAASAVAVSVPAPRVIVTRVRTVDGSVVTVATFRGPVQYVLHNGSQDPGPAAAGLVRAGPVVTGAERKRLLAAFNGGFKLAAGAGGYEQEGHVISPLLQGLASLVIDRSGRARIGVRGRGVPAPGEAVYSVRQNLQPLVLNGQPTPAAADWGLWGATLGGGAYVARSALGQDASGDLIYAASLSAIPADLAEALARSGARIAMELDINPEWVQLDAARRAGGPLTAQVPGQTRPASQYLEGWTRDFITVLAPLPPAAAPLPPSKRLRPLGAHFSWASVFDRLVPACNHNYMNTQQEGSEPADDATGTNASSQTTSGHGKGTATEEVRGWFSGRLPGDWFTATPEIQVDREEITIVGVLPAPETAGASDAERAAAAEGRIRRFREETRGRRIEIAREAEHKFRRKVSWGVTCADVTEMFTTLSVPVMTRLRQPERRVLDTLVDAGVARSRSDALAWCVRLTGENADAWLSRLRAALRHVEEVRDQGPGSA